jgi:hypothetical protein
MLCPYQIFSFFLFPFSFNVAPSVLLPIAYPCGLGIWADVRDLGAEHSRIEGIANFINPIDLSQQIRRGVAFAPQFLNSSQKSRSANAAPSVLLPIAYPCGLEIWGGCQRFRAKHSRIEGIAKFINPFDLSQQIRRGVAFAPQFLTHHRNLYSQMLRPLCFYLSLRFGDLGGCQRFRAKHSRIEGIANFINFCGNALPLPEFSLFPYSSIPLTCSNKL